MAEQLTKPAWRDSPGVWFSLLCNALAEHDFDRAAEAQTNLDRLGVLVRFRGLETVCKGSGDRNTQHEKGGAHDAL